MTRDPIGPSAAPAALELEIALAAPVDLAGSLAPFGRWGDDRLDRWAGGRLVRTQPATDGGGVWPYVGRPEGAPDRPALRVTALAPAGVPATSVADAIRATFVMRHSELRDLAAADERVRGLAQRHPGIVPVLVPDPFTALVRSISAQQVNLPWAATIRRRLAERYGTRHAVGGLVVYSLHPAALAEATVAELRGLQLTTSKSVSLVACAAAALAGEVDRAQLAALDDEALIAHLTRLPGIGRWSAEWFLARTLGRPRVVAGDLGVRKAIGRMYDTDSLPSEDEVRRLTAHWAAAATMAQALALHDLALAAVRA